MIEWLNNFLFIAFCSFSVMTGFYLARNFWFFASEGMDEMIDIIRLYFTKK